jgi:hypothetical protein
MYIRLNEKNSPIHFTLLTHTYIYIYIKLESFNCFFKITILVFLEITFRFLKK